MHIFPKEGMRIELLTELGESPSYQLETVFLYGKILNFADPEKTDI